MPGAGPIKAAVAAALVFACAAAGAPSSPLPDLDQVPPQAVSVVEHDGRLLLVFASAVDNRGPGPLVVQGYARRGDTMRARQLVGSRSYPLPTRLRYVHSQTHEHWHLADFERYELRRATDFSLAARDRKTGFCLNDAYARRPYNSLPAFGGDCGKGRRYAGSIREGISVGWGDDYVPRKEGQSIDVTHLEPGVYVLVHRVNPEHVLREQSYANNAASVLLALDGPRLRVLERCPRAPRCGT
jgi:hypothetical protein